jgi:hypothetical protein
MADNDRTQKPNKPQGEKQSEKVTDLSEKSTSEKDEQVKGGRMKQRDLL